MRAPQIALLGLAWLAAGASPAAAAVIRVGGDAPSLAAALEAAADGDTIELPPGRFEGGLRVEKAVTLRGSGSSSIVDGGGRGRTITLAAPGASVEAMTVTGSGHDVGRSDACVYLEPGATGAAVVDTELVDCAFGIWVHETHGATLRGNRVVGREDERPTDRGNGIHLHNASGLRVAGNEVVGARDGIYVAATENSVIEDNHLHHQRFGVHYMYSYDNTLRGNVSTDNTVGFALMESLRLVVTGNRAERNVRNGLLFRDVQFSTIRGNELVENGNGMFFFSSTENVIEDNRIANNEMGLKVWAGTRRNRVVGNEITGNRQQVFYVGAEDQIWGAEGRGNRWGDYLGWDQDGDGVGDRPHRVDSFTARLVYQYPASVLLLRSPALEMLAHLAAQLPLLRAPTVVDVAPLLEAAR